MDPQGMSRLRRCRRPNRCRGTFGVSVAAAAGAAALLLPAVADSMSGQLGRTELEACVAQLPECLELALQVPTGGEEEEAAAIGLLRAWLSERYSQPSMQGNPDQAAIPVEAGLGDALGQLLMLSERVTTEGRPALALGVGQMLHSFFWWGVPGDGGGPSTEAISQAFALHELALDHAGCRAAEAPTESFLQRKCPWRWRFVVLLGVELGRQLLVGGYDIHSAVVLLRRIEDHLQELRKLPFFWAHKVANPLHLNQNWDYFPESRHWPIWPREFWPPIGSFLERHAPTFRRSLDALLKEDPDGGRFQHAAARQAGGLTPGHLQWTRLKLIHSGGASELCKLQFMQESCALLAERAEIGPRCKTELSGASLARLLPGAELKPHFGTHPRLTVHLGLQTPKGASMTVAGETFSWHEGQAVIFDDSYIHSVRHRGVEARYVLVAWLCHPCDLAWRSGQGPTWEAENPLPAWCGPGGGAAPVPGYGSSL